MEGECTDIENAKVSEPETSEMPLTCTVPVKMEAQVCVRNPKPEIEIPSNESLARLMAYDSGNSSSDDSKQPPQSFSRIQSKSSDSESDSSTSSSSLSHSLCREDLSSEDEDVAGFKEVATSSDKGQGVNVKKSRGGPKTKGELTLDDLPPIEKLTISVKEEECMPLGAVYSIVDSLLVVESLAGTPPLNLDSVVFTKDGKAVGRIFDVFGPVKRPFYSLRFNSRKDIEERGLTVGTTLYCAPQTSHTSYVFTHQLFKEKGSDASWRHNNEPPPGQLDYSDDESEQIMRSRHKKNRGNTHPEGSMASESTKPAAKQWYQNSLLPNRQMQPRPEMQSRSQMQTRQMTQQWQLPPMPLPIPSQQPQGWWERPIKLEGGGWSRVEEGAQGWRGRGQQQGWSQMQHPRSPFPPPRPAPPRFTPSPHSFAQRPTFPPPPTHYYY